MLSFPVSLLFAESMLLTMTAVWFVLMGIVTIVNAVSVTRATGSGIWILQLVFGILAVLIGGYSFFQPLLMALLAALPDTGTLLHGDFHTNNVFLQRGEPLLIDMDRLSTGHPILELSDLYYFYVLLGEESPATVERFMGFSYDTAQRFMHLFLKYYLGTDEEARLNAVADKASLIGYSRLIRKLRKQREPAESDRILIRRCVARIAELTEKLDTLTF